MKLLLIFFFLFSNSSFSEVNTIARSPRGLLMGDAYTAVVDDEYALFYNPAALGRHSGFTFNPVNPLVTIINPLNNLDIVENFPNTTQGMANALVGIPFKTSAGFTPGFRMGRFGFSAFYNTDVTFNLMDQTQPVLDLSYKEDKGFAVGYAMVMGNRLESKTSAGNQLSLGFGLKHIDRSGLKGMFPLLGTDLSSATGSDIEAIAESLGKNRATGWGFDLGVEHISSTGNSRFINSFVMKDIFNVRFDHERPGSEVPQQDMAVNFGTAFQQNYEFFSATFSVDIRNLLEDQELLRRLHFGAEIALPGLSVLGGWRTGYFSYGVMFHAMIFQVYVGLYAEELSPGYDLLRADQALIYFSLLNFRFDD